jgi:hypothetical protein
MIRVLALAFLLTGCNARLGGITWPEASINSPVGSSVGSPVGSATPPLAADINIGTDEIIANENDMCLERARHFHGLVRIPCDQIARQAAP